MKLEFNLAPSELQLLCDSFCFEVSICYVNEETAKLVQVRFMMATCPHGLDVYISMNVHTLTICLLQMQCTVVLHVSPSCL